MKIAAQLLMIAGVLFVLWHCICALNAMTPRTRHGLRAAVSVLAIGCFAEGAMVIAGHSPGLGELLLVAGLALGTHYNRRVGICPCVVQVVERPPRSGAPT